MTDELLVQLYYAAQSDITRFRIKARALLAASAPNPIAEPVAMPYPRRLLHESDQSLAWRVDSFHDRNAPLANPSDKQEAVALDEAKGMLRLFYEACTAYDPETGPYLDADKLHEAFQVLEAKGIQYLRGSDGNWPIAAPLANPSDKQESQFADVIGERFDDWFQSQQGTAYDGAYAFAKAAWDYQEKHIDMMADHLKSCLDRIEELQQIANPSDKQEAMHDSVEGLSDGERIAIVQCLEPGLARHILDRFDYPSDKQEAVSDDTVSRAARIMRLVDEYEHWRTKETRDTLRHALYDELRACHPAQSAEQDVPMDPRLNPHGIVASPASAQSAEQDVLAKVLFALTERQKGNVIRSEDGYVDEARAVLKGVREKLKSAEQDRIDAELPENINWTLTMALAEKHGDGWSDEKGWSFHCDDDLFNFAGELIAKGASK